MIHADNINEQEEILRCCNKRNINEIYHGEIQVKYHYTFKYYFHVLFSLISQFENYART